MVRTVITCPKMDRYNNTYGSLQLTTRPVTLNQQEMAEKMWSEIIDYLCNAGFGNRNAIVTIVQEMRKFDPYFSDLYVLLDFVTGSDELTNKLVGIFNHPKCIPDSVKELFTRSDVVILDDLTRCANLLEFTMVDENGNGIDRKYQEEKYRKIFCNNLEVRRVKWYKLCNTLESESLKLVYVVKRILEKLGFNMENYTGSSTTFLKKSIDLLTQNKMVNIRTEQRATTRNDSSYQPVPHMSNFDNTAGYDEEEILSIFLIKLAVFRESKQLQYVMELLKLKFPTGNYKNNVIPSDDIIIMRNIFKEPKLQVFLKNICADNKNMFKQIWEFGIQKPTTQEMKNAYMSIIDNTSLYDLLQTNDEEFKEWYQVNYKIIFKFLEKNVTDVTFVNKIKTLPNSIFKYLDGKNNSLFTNMELITFLKREQQKEAIRSKSKSKNKNKKSKKGDKDEIELSIPFKLPDTADEFIMEEVPENEPIFINVKEKQKSIHEMDVGSFFVKEYITFNEEKLKKIADRLIAEGCESVSDIADEEGKEIVFELATDVLGKIGVKNFKKAWNDAIKRHGLGLDKDNKEDSDDLEEGSMEIDSDDEPAADKAIKKSVLLSSKSKNNRTKN